MKKLSNDEMKKVMGGLQDPIGGSTTCGSCKNSDQCPKDSTSELIG